MNRLARWRFRWHLARTIQRRDLRATLHSFSLYITLSVAIAAAATVLRNYVKSVQDDGLYVLAHPFVVPFFATAILSSIYMAIVSTTTVARERDRGSLEVLFYSPIDIVAYLLGKYLALMSTFVLMVIVYVVVLLTCALVTNLSFDLTLSWAAVLSVATASAVVAVGILLSTLDWSARGAILLVLLGIQAGYDRVPGLTGGSAQGQSGLLLFLQTIWGWLNHILEWLSPFACLERGIDALLRGSAGEYVLVLGLSSFYTVVAFGLAVRTLRRKGVR